MGCTWRPDMWDEGRTCPPDCKLLRPEVLRPPGCRINLATSRWQRISPSVGAGVTQAASQGGGQSELGVNHGRFKSGLPHAQLCDLPQAALPTSLSLAVMLCN